MLKQVSEVSSAEVLLEHAPKEAHERSNGECEIAVRHIQGMSRTFHESLALNGIALDAKQAVLCWLVEHAAFTLSVHGRGEPADGITPYQRLRGKPWRVAYRVGMIPPFRRKNAV